MACVVRRLKGVVINKKDGLVQIELETGRCIWATPTFNILIREQILISWDYTHDCIHSITTPARLACEETDEDIAEAETDNHVVDNKEGGDNDIIEEKGEIKSEDFSLPLVEEDEDEVEAEGEVFSSPKDDEFEDESDMVSVHRHNINPLLLS